MGYNDEVLDVKFVGKDDSHIVVATNSCQLKVFELLTNSCQILYGHTGQSPAEGSKSMFIKMHVETAQYICLLTRGQKVSTVLQRVCFAPFKDL